MFHDDEAFDGVTKRRWQCASDYWEIDLIVLLGEGCTLDVFILEFLASTLAGWQKENLVFVCFLV